MKRYSIIQPVYMSFYSRELYRDVARNWGGSVFVYLLALLALCWIPAMGKVKSELGTFIRYELPKVATQMPEIAIKGGKASVDAEMPYTINDPETGKPIAILDTTGQTTSLEGSDALMLLTRDSLIAKRSDNETRVYSLAEVDDFLVNQEVINVWMGVFDEWFFVVMYPFALMSSYIFRVLQVLVYAAIGIMYDRSMKAGLGYGALVRVAAVAVTPAIILNTVRFSMGWDMPGWTFVTFMTAMGYIYFGVMANAEARAAGEGRGE